MSEAESSRSWVGSMPAAYDELLGPTLFAPFAVDLSRRLSESQPEGVLELAAGTGILTAALVAALPDTAVTATDLNPAMVDYGRERVSRATWRVADATTLPFDDDGFDAVACQFGVMFFPDRRRAFAEVRRVLAPGGRFAFTTWAPAAEHAFAAALTEALDRVFEHDAPRFVVAVPHGYSDPDAVAADLDHAGLDCLAAERVTLTGEAPSARHVARGFCTGTPLRAELEARGEVETLTEAVAHEMERSLGRGPVRGTMAAHVFEARPR